MDSFVIVLAALFMLILGVASYVTSLACRREYSRHQRVGWHLGLLGTAAAGVIVGLLIVLGLCLQPGAWGKIDFRAFFVWFCFCGSAVAILPSELVVWCYRRKRM